MWLQSKNRWGGMPPERGKMSSTQQAGSPSGSITHLWNSDLGRQIAERHRFSAKRSKLALPTVNQDLPIEAQLTTIAAQLNAESWLELGDNTFTILNKVGWQAVESAQLLAAEDCLVGYLTTPSFSLPQILSVAQLARVFDIGYTPADLLELGVPRDVIAQLCWWQLRAGETLLSQHVRAELAGLSLPLVGFGYRTIWRHLFRFVGDDEDSLEFLQAHEVELSEIRAVLRFFSHEDSASGDISEPKLAESEQAKWALAFNPELELLLPDLWGPFSHFPKELISKGKLLRPLTTLARYLVSLGVTPKDWSANSELRGKFHRSSSSGKD
jgi:hypothetical protein